MVQNHGTYQTVYLDRREGEQPLLVRGLTWHECDACGEVVLDDKAMSTIEAARRRELGLLNPQEIRELRTSLGKSQAGMSELLGLGEKTYCRWESGSYMQSEASDRYMRMLTADAKNIGLLEKIAAAKNKGPEEDLVREEFGKCFTYLEDVAAAEERERGFVDLFTVGELQVA